MPYFISLMDLTFYFLNAVPPSLSHEDKLGILEDICRMHSEGKKKLNVKRDTCEGKIENTGRYHVIGTLGGVQYNVVLDAKEGEKRFGMLVANRLNPEMN